MNGRATRWSPRTIPHDPPPSDYATEAGRTSEDFEFQMLYGIRDEESAAWPPPATRSGSTRPTARQWFGYFMRRLAERPANVLFFLRSLISRN